MKKGYFVFWLLIIVCLAPLTGCGSSGETNDTSDQPAPGETITETTAAEANESTSSETDGAVTTVKDTTDDAAVPAVEIEKTALIQPDDLVYQGAFRLPDEYVTVWDDQVNFWSYSGMSMAFNPNGDPAGDTDGFPGSIFASGHDVSQFVSEIAIPSPVISDTIADLPVARTLQKPADITGGMFGYLELPTQGLAIQNDRLFFCRGQHFQGDEPSHGWCSLDLADPDPAGPWRFGGYTNYVTNDYLFEIPTAWSDRYTPGLTLASGRFREGVWGGFGPTLFAYSPESQSSSVLQSVRPLLLYGTQEPGQVEITTTAATRMNGYSEPDSWSGGAWLTDGDRSAVIFSGTKAIGNYWYGFGNGVVWEYDCAEHDPPDCPEVPDWPYSDRGYWADDIQSMILFFDPSDLAAVATGQMDSWEPQPYATWCIDDYLFDGSGYDYERGKRQILGACAFDSRNGILYVFERMVADDEEKSIVHVWKIGG